MNLELGWVLLGLPLAFVLGWLASKIDARQLRMENRQAPKSYFKGLNFLLNDEQDEAIKAFKESVQSDPDTAELHFALGNLFRRRGEFEHAVTVHEHLLARGDLSKADRERAQHALALDFLKAGLLDRAENALQKLQGTPFEAQSLTALLAIYERSRDWPQATKIAESLRALGNIHIINRQAHYLCEQANALVNQKQYQEARILLEKAVDISPKSVRPHIDLASVTERLGNSAKAYEILSSLIAQDSHLTPIFVRQFAQLAVACDHIHQALALLVANYKKNPSLDVVDAIVQLDAFDSTQTNARDWYVKHLERTPSLIAAAKWISEEKLEHEQFHTQVQRALDHAVTPLRRYRCTHCGFEATQHHWNCPGCQSWDSYPALRIEEL